jgi:hypothetical protein
MAETNGKPVTMPEQTEREPYRPTASTKSVYDTIANTLCIVVEMAANEASSYVSLFDRYDRDASFADRFQHLVDATECLEIALTHLGQLKAAAQQRQLMEYEQNEPLSF